jgi:hypothetical protein
VKLLSFVKFHFTFISSFFEDSSVIDDDVDASELLFRRNERVSETLQVANIALDKGDVGWNVARNVFHNVAFDKGDVVWNVARNAIRNVATNVFCNVALGKGDVGWNVVGNDSVGNHYFCSGSNKSASFCFQKSFSVLVWNLMLNTK